MRSWRFLILILALLGGATGLSLPSRAAPLPVTAAAQTGAEPLVQTARWHYRRHWHRRHHGWRRHYWRRPHFYRRHHYRRPFYGYRRHYHRPFYRRRYGWRPFY